MRSNKLNISEKSLEKLLIVISSLTDEDGILLNITFQDVLQDWLLDKLPKDSLYVKSKNLYEIPHKQI